MASNPVTAGIRVEPCEGNTTLQCVGFSSHQDIYWLLYIMQVELGKLSLIFWTQHDPVLFLVRQST